MMEQELSRRTLLKGGGAALAGLSALQLTGPAHAFPGDPKFLKWEALDSFYTDPANFFIVSHYAEPTVDPVTYRLDVGGMVARPQSLTLADLRQMRRREVTFTLEC